MTIIRFDAATIAELSMSQVIEDEETGELLPHPLYGDRASITLMLPPGFPLPPIPLGGVWEVTLEGGHDQPDHPADPRSPEGATS